MAEELNEETNTRTVEDAAISEYGTNPGIQDTDLYIIEDASGNNYKTPWSMIKTFFTNLFAKKTDLDSYAKKTDLDSYAKTSDVADTYASKDSPLFTGKIKSADLTTDDKQVVYGLGKTIWLGNEKVDTTYLQNKNKTIDIEDLLTTSYDCTTYNKDNTAYNSEYVSNFNIKIITLGNIKIINLTIDFVKAGVNVSDVIVGLPEVKESVTIEISDWAGNTGFLRYQTNGNIMMIWNSNSTLETIGNAVTI